MHKVHTPLPRCQHEILWHIAYCCAEYDRGLQTDEFQHACILPAAAAAAPYMTCAIRQKCSASLCTSSPDTAHHQLPQMHLWHAAKEGEPPLYNEMVMAERWPHALARLPAHLFTHIALCCCTFRCYELCKR